MMGLLPMTACKAGSRCGERVFGDLGVLVVDKLIFHKC